MKEDDFYTIIGRLTCLKVYLKPDDHSLIDDIIAKFIKNLAESKRNACNL